VIFKNFWHFQNFIFLKLDVKKKNKKGNNRGQTIPVYKFKKFNFTEPSFIKLSIYGYVGRRQTPGLLRHCLCFCNCRNILKCLLANMHVQILPYLRSSISLYFYVPSPTTLAPTTQGSCTRTRSAPPSVRRNKSATDAALLWCRLIWRSLVNIYSCNLHHSDFG